MSQQLTSEMSSSDGDGDGEIAMGDGDGDGERNDERSWWFVGRVEGTGAGRQQLRAHSCREEGKIKRRENDLVDQDGAG